MSVRHADRLTMGDVVQRLQAFKFKSPNYVSSSLEQLRGDEPRIYYDVSVEVLKMPDGSPLATQVVVIERDRLTDKELLRNTHKFMLTSISISDVVSGVQLVYPAFVPTQEVANYVQKQW